MANSHQEKLQMVQSYVNEVYINIEDNAEANTVTHVEESSNLLTSIEMTINEHSIYSFNPQKFDEATREMVVPWYYGCLYSCELCAKQFFEKIDITNHVQSRHKIPIQKYEKKWHLGTVEDIHECEICGTGVTWTKLNILNHMLSEHELKIDQYYDEFKDYIDPPKLKIRDKNLINDGQESTENEEDMSSCWADKCVFQCDVCVPNEVLDSLFKFEKHVHFWTLFGS